MLTLRSLMQTHGLDWEEWKAECTRVLEGNRPDRDTLDGLAYRYTCPAREKGHYLPQWLWDSCFHALVYRWFDTGMAWEELQSLFVHQVPDGDEAGMVPHMAHFEANHAAADQRLFRQRDRSVLTQPPLIAVAALAVHRKDPRRDILQAMYPRLKRYHEWFDRRRDPDGDGLVAIIHPWESGWDASQRWDRIMGITGPTREQLSSLSDKRKALVDLILQHDCNAAALADVEDGFYVEPADFNAIRAADLEALATIARELGEDEEASSLDQRARAIRQAIRDKMLSRVAGSLRAHDLVGAQEKKDSPDTAAKFVLMFGNCVTPEEARALRDELEAPASPFHTPYPIPTTSIDHPWFDGDEYWRGNVWLPVNWLVYTGLRNYRLDGAAQRLAAKSLELVQKKGFCEFFNPISGARGSRLGRLCPQNQSWSTIVLDMLGSLRVEFPGWPWASPAPPSSPPLPD
jgi:glycogen debranching enzyme